MTKFAIMAPIAETLAGDSATSLPNTVSPTTQHYVPHYPTVCPPLLPQLPSTGYSMEEHGWSDIENLPSSNSIAGAKASKGEDDLLLAGPRSLPMEFNRGTA